MHEANTIPALDSSNKVSPIFVRATAELTKKFADKFTQSNDYATNKILLKQLWFEEYQAEIIENDDSLILKFNNDFSKTMFLVRFS